MADQPGTTTATTQTPAEPVSSDLSPEKMMQDNLLLLGTIFFIFYFLLIRPHQKRLKMHKDLMKSLAKGNKVLTNGGLIGVIIKFEGDDVVVIEVAPNVRVRVSRTSVSEVLSDKVNVGDAANDD